MRSFLLFLFCLTLFVRAEEVVETNSAAVNPELLALPVYPSVEEESQKTAVVYNEKYEPSVKIARHYQKVRGIPEKNMISLSLPFEGMIKREDYLEKIENPILKNLNERGLFWSEKEGFSENAIRYLVLCRGLPFRILNSASDLVNKETQKTGAAVDNELAVLALKVKNSEIPLQGALICPAAKSQNPKQISPQNGTLMVARLDGPTDEIAFHLVDKAVQAEQQGLWGKAVIDLRGLTNTAYLVGDQWIKTALTAWGSHGYDVVADYQPETIAEDKPLDSVAFYAGWYSYSPTGPFKNRFVEFMPGAFAYHLHSFSAQNLYTETEHWVGPLLSLGATCTAGYVDEPFLSYTLNVGEFAKWFLIGASFGEAIYHSLPTLSWQTTVIGDPLYRPFRISGYQRYAETVNKYPELSGWANTQVAILSLQKENKDSEKILTFVESEFKKSPKDYALAQWLFHFYQTQHQYEQALEICERIIPQIPASDEKVKYLSMMLEKINLQILLKNYEAANDSCRELAEEVPQIKEEEWFLNKWETIASKDGSKKTLRSIKKLKSKIK